MKLRLEPRGARRAQFAGAGGAPLRAGARTWLELAVAPQPTRHRCWAAIGAAVAAYYHRTTLDPRTLAGELDEPRALDEVLAALGCFGHWSAGKPTFARIAHDIDGGRPLAARVQWRAGGAHYVLVRGYDARRGSLLIEDSLAGPGEHDYDAFPAHHALGAGVWTETLWTERQPTQPRSDS